MDLFKFALLDSKNQLVGYLKITEDDDDGLVIRYPPGHLITRTLPLVPLESKHEIYEGATFIYKRDPGIVAKLVYSHELNGWQLKWTDLVRDRGMLSSVDLKMWAFAYNVWQEV